MVGMMSLFRCRVADSVWLRSEQWSIYLIHIDKVEPPWTENTASALFELLDVVKETRRMGGDWADITYLVWQKLVIRTLTRNY